MPRERVPHGAAIDGFHVEGPHISPEDGPARRASAAVGPPARFREFRRWQDAARGRVRIVTLSPEWPEAPRYIEQVAGVGVVVSIGHTQANTAQLADAVSAGATLSTHLGNGSHTMLRRHPNYIWDQMADDRLTAGLIVDGIHLDASFLRVALRAKGLERSVLVTDASSPAGAAPGRYRLGEQDVDHTADGRVVLAGTDRLAGSALTMNRGIENLMRLAGLTLDEAVRLATVNPARAGRVTVDPGDRVCSGLRPPSRWSRPGSRANGCTPLDQLLIQVTDGGELPDILGPARGFAAGAEVAAAEEVAGGDHGRAHGPVLIGPLGPCELPVHPEIEAHDG